MRIRVQVCIEKQAPDGTWAPVMCSQGGVYPTTKLSARHSLEAGHVAQQAADELIREAQRRGVDT